MVVVFETCCKGVTFFLTLERCRTPCDYHTKRHLNIQKVVWTCGALVIFGFCMCLAPQWLALFRHLNFQKWFENGVFCTFWFGQFPIVVLRWCALCILTRIRAWRRNSMQLFISHLAGWLRTRRFSEPTFWRSGATNHWTMPCFATLPPSCAPASSVFCLSFLTFLSASSHPCFSCVQIVGSLTSKFLLVNIDLERL